jgi:hypothetical protein
MGVDEADTHSEQHHENEAMLGVSEEDFTCSVRTSTPVRVNLSGDVRCFAGVLAASASASLLAVPTHILQSLRGTDSQLEL